MLDYVANLSAKHFDSGLYCAESVLLAIAQTKNLRNELIPKIATGFCSGLSRTSGMCGAVAGGIMSINIFFGRNKPSDSVEKNYRAIQTFISLFEKKFGSSNCKILIDCDLNTDAGQKKFINNNLKERCQLYTRIAARMAMSVIEEHQD